MVNPSVTLQVLSSELELTVDQIRYQRKQLEVKGLFHCRKDATKKWDLGDPTYRQSVTQQFSPG